MSSPKGKRGKTTGAKTPRTRTARKTVSSKVSKPAKAKAAKADEISTHALQLAATIESGLANGNTEIVSERALQDLMAALCKTYSAQVEAGNKVSLLRGRTIVNSTDIMTTASGLLKAANLAVFELGMWQSWTGR
jgi:hypothetical protein